MPSFGKWIHARFKIPQKVDPRTFYVEHPLSCDLSDIPSGAILLFSHLDGTWWQRFLTWSIQYVSQGECCHAALYMGSGKNEIIEAAPKGVIACSLKKYLNKRDMIWIWVLSSMTVEQLAHVKNYAYSRVGAPYDYWNLVDSFLLGHGNDTPGKVICSELVARAYSAVGLKCSDMPSDQTDPSDIMRFCRAREGWILAGTQNVKDGV